MKKIIISIICGLTCVTGGVTAGVALNTPEYVLSESITDAVDDLLEREDISTLLEIFEQGSLEVDYSQEEMVSFGGKVYFGLDKSQLYFENVNTTLYNYYEDGSNLTVSANAYLSEDMAYIENEKYLDGAYGIKFKKLSEQFENSIFYEDSEFALPKEQREIIESFLDYYENDFDALQKDSEKLRKRYLKQLGKAIKEYGEFESETKNVKLNGEKSEKRVVSLKLDEDAVASIVEDVLDYIIEDEKFEEFVKTHIANLNELSSYDIGTSIDADDLYDQLIDYLEEIQDDADSIKKGNFEIEITVVTPKLSTKLLKLSVEVEDNGYDTSFELDFGEKGVKKSEYIELSVNDNKVCSYEIKENSKDKFEVEFVTYNTYLDETEKYLSVEYQLNKKSDKFSISVMQEELEVLLIKGKAEVDGNTVTFKPEECILKEETEFYNSETYTYETKVIETSYLENIDLVVIVSTKDKMPKPNKNFENVLEITEEKLKKILEDLEEDEIA